MKLKLNYEITEFTEADALNFNAVRDRFYTELAALHMVVIDEMRAKQREILQAKLDEERRWARFMHFCHTGVML